MKRDWISTEFIRKYIDEAPTRAALIASGRADLDAAYVATQIKGLQTLRRKAPSWSFPEIEIPSGVSVEQCSSERMARFKAALFGGVSALDLTGGLGIDAWAWSASFERVTYVERDGELCATAQRNFERLGARNIRCVEAEAEDFMAGNHERFDLIYVDPSRRDDQGRKVFRIADCAPDVGALAPALLAAAPQVLIKLSPMLDVQAALRDLPDTRRVWVTSMGGECKELLFLLSKSPRMGMPAHIAVLGKTGDTTLDFDLEEEQSAPAPALSGPLAYLYEPDAAILKAGLFKSFAHRYGLSKLHPHTHLYASHTLRPSLPARTFEVLDYGPYDIRFVRDRIPSGQANISVRNFPDSADQARKRLRLKDGGDVYLFAATGPANEKLLILCRRCEP